MDKIELRKKVFSKIDELPCLKEIRQADLQTLGMEKEDLEQMKAYLDSSKEGIYAFFDAMK